MKKLLSVVVAVAVIIALVGFTTGTSDKTANATNCYGSVKAWLEANQDTTPVVLFEPATKDTLPYEEFTFDVQGDSAMEFVVYVDSLKQTVTASFIDDSQVKGRRVRSGCNCEETLQVLSRATNHPKRLGEKVVPFKQGTLDVTLANYVTK